MTDGPEFSRAISPDSFGAAPTGMVFDAGPDERAALAARFGVIEISSLDAAAEVHRDGRVVLAKGTVQSDIKQACVISGEVIDAHIHEGFELRFVPELPHPDAEEIELTDADCETLVYDKGVIDLGEAIAQTMALAIDPFPRSLTADSETAGLISEEEAGPFGALKALRDTMRDEGSGD